jgi:hypothetical protein
MVTLATSTDPQFLAVDSKNVYWTDDGDGSSGNTGTGSVLSVPIAGGTVTTLATGLLSPAGIAVDATDVYWVDFGLLDPPGDVMKVAVSGGTPVTLATSTGGGTPTHITIDAKNVYWTDGNAVWQIPKGGGTPLMLAEHKGGLTSGIAVDSTYVYWTSEESPDGGSPLNTGSVMKTPIGGGATTVLATGQSIPLDLKVDGKNLYWANQGETTKPNGMVMKLPLAGGSPVPLAMGQNTVFDLAIDSTHVYWNDWGQQTLTMTNGSLMSVPIAGGTPTTIAAQVQPYDLVVDGTNLYATLNFAHPSHGTIVKIALK